MKERSGKYAYRGYTITNHGYYPPDHCVWWEAVKDGNADYHGHTLREVIRQIDDGFHADEVRELKKRIERLEYALWPIRGCSEDNPDYYASCGHAVREAQRRLKGAPA